jgi:hypothetical protein
MPPQRAGERTVAIASVMDVFEERALSKIHTGNTVATVF